MGNDNYSKVVSMGDIHLETNKGARLILKDVRHVLDIRFNLILVKKLDDEGYSTLLVIDNGNLLNVHWLWPDERRVLACM